MKGENLTIKKIKQSKPKKMSFKFEENEEDKKEKEFQRKIDKVNKILSHLEKFG